LKYRLLHTIIAIFFCTSVNCQEDSNATVLTTDTVPFIKQKKRSKKKSNRKLNEVHLDLLGKSVIYGVAYDRILIDRKIEWHVNIGFTPPPISRYEKATRWSNSLFIWNLSTYIKTSIWKVNPVFGVGTTHGITQSAEWSIRTENYIFAVFTAGISYKLNENWHMMIKYTPSLIFTETKSVRLEEPYETTYRNDSGFWPYYGGITFGHRF